MKQITILLLCIALLLVGCHAVDYGCIDYEYEPEPRFTYHGSERMNDTVAVPLNEAVELSPELAHSLSDDNEYKYFIDTMEVFTDENLSTFKAMYSASDSDFYFSYALSYLLTKDIMQDSSLSEDNITLLEEYMDTEFEEVVRMCVFWVVFHNMTKEEGNDRTVKLKYSEDGLPGELDDPAGIREIAESFLYGIVAFSGSGFDYIIQSSGFDGDEDIVITHKLFINKEMLNYLIDDDLKPRKIFNGYGYDDAFVETGMYVDFIISNMCMLLETCNDPDILLGDLWYAHWQYLIDASAGLESNKMKTDIMNSWVRVLYYSITGDGFDMDEWYEWWEQRKKEGGQPNWH